ncbi:MAG: pentapeptide repeat-containing protein, partial [Acidimicrobiales bacterium]
MADNGIIAGDPERSYRGRSLEHADFSGTDLRGVDFSDASLRSASFRNATFGVAPRVGIVMLAIAVVAAIVAGFVIGLAVAETRDQLSAAEWDEVAGGGTIGLVLIMLIALIFWRGFDVALKVVAIVYPVILVLNIVANLVWDEVEWLVALRVTGVIVFAVFAIAVG